MHKTVDGVYRAESRRILATLIRLLGDFDLAEEAMREAFAAALLQWPREGLPSNPRAWLVSVGRFKAIDAVRKRARFNASLAEIAAVHAQAEEPSATDWAQIVSLCDGVHAVNPSPIVELNRAVAAAMRDGPSAGVALIDDLLSRGQLADYHLAHSARAELCRRAGRTTDAVAFYRRAIALTQQGPEKRYIEGRIAGQDNRV